MPQASEKVSAPSRPALRLARGNSIRLSLFGGFAARSSNCAGGPPPVSAPRHQAMLAYLAMRPRFSETRERLAALLWSESGEVQARQNLRQCLVRIRREFAPLGIDPVIVSAREIRLDPARITVDAMEFHDLARSGQPQDLEAAMALYQGAFLDGLNLGQESFDEWHQAEHARFERAAAQVMQKCARHRDQSGDGAGAVRAAESLVAVDSLNEDSQRLYLRMLARHQGREAALGHARTLTRLIKQECPAGPHKWVSSKLFSE